MEFRVSTVVCVWDGLAQVLCHSGKNTVADVLGRAFQLVHREDLQQVQVHVGPAEVGGVAEDGASSPKGADHNGHLGPLGNFKDAVPEGLQVTGPAGISLGKHGNARLVLLQNVYALQNGLQGLPVIFPVDGLAQGFVHQLVHDEQPVVFLLGDEGQLTFLSVDVENEGVQQAEVVTHQEEAPFPGQLLQAGGMDFDLEQG